MSQYALNLPLTPVFSADNFFVGNCNRDALTWIDAWPEWPAQALVLYGPSGSGKSHLGAIWAMHSKAMMVSAATLSEPQKGNWLLEDIEKAPNQRQLLHWINYVRETGGNLLLTSQCAAKDLPFTLPDLTSRLLALPSVQIVQPDDEVLAGVIRKQFADRQMKIDDEVINYLVPRMERSLAKAKELVNLLDSKALAEGRNITVPFVKRVIEKI